MTIALPDLKAAPGRFVLVGDCGSTVARDLRDRGHLVVELLPSDFRGCGEGMADVVAVLPTCSDAERVGAVAAACAKCVWFQERAAPRAVADLLTAAGVPVVEGKDLIAECDA